MGERDPLSRFVIVPAKPTHDMEAAHFEAHAKAAEVFASVPEVWSAMIAASPALTDEVIDGLCVSYAYSNPAGPEWWWRKDTWGMLPVAGAEQRDYSRGIMRTFLSRLATPTEENPS